MGTATLVKFKDLLEDDGEIHFGILFEDGNLLCMCCGSTVEEGDYEIVEDVYDWWAADQALLAEFED